MLQEDLWFALFCMFLFTNSVAEDLVKNIQKDLAPKIPIFSRGRQQVQVSLQYWLGTYQFSGTVEFSKISGVPEVQEHQIRAPAEYRTTATWLQRTFTARIKEPKHLCFSVGAGGVYIQKKIRIYIHVYLTWIHIYH